MKWPVGVFMVCMTVGCSPFDYKDKYRHVVGVNAALTHEREGLRRDLNKLQIGYEAISEQYGRLRQELDVLGQDMEGHAREFEERAKRAEAGAGARQAEAMAELRGKVREIEGQLGVVLATNDAWSRKFSAYLKRRRARSAAGRSAGKNPPKIPGKHDSSKAGKKTVSSQKPREGNTGGGQGSRETMETMETMETKDARSAPKKPFSSTPGVKKQAAADDAPSTPAPSAVNVGEPLNGPQDKLPVGLQQDGPLGTVRKDQR